MSTLTATGVACANIAFIKYWGNRDAVYRLPVNGSISMNLAGLETRTTVTYSTALPKDTLTINNQPADGKALERVSHFLNIVRNLAGVSDKADVVSATNFPMGAGIASSAAGFSALALAASRAAGLTLNERDLSRLARRGSGSACRSIPCGFVEWYAGSSDEDSFAQSIAPPDHWNIVDIIAIVQAGEKSTGSTEGHELASTSPLQSARVLDTPRRLEICRKAILEKDFASFSSIVQHDSDLMHAVMMTSRPALFYWEPASLQIIKAIHLWRSQDLPVCYTLDAGANVHILCPEQAAQEVQNRLKHLQGIDQQIISRPGAGVSIIK
jgi:diphosphomevalonate decarboxylase